MHDIFTQIVFVFFYIFADILLYVSTSVAGKRKNNQIPDAVFKIGNKTTAYC